jgi:hypothetical protein
VRSSLSGLLPSWEAPLVGCALRVVSGLRGRVGGRSVRARCAGGGGARALDGVASEMSFPRVGASTHGRRGHWAQEEARRGHGTDAGR